jgi:hypothetical protein
MHSALKTVLLNIKAGVTYPCPVFGGVNEVPPVPRIASEETQSRNLITFNSEFP